MKKKSDPKYFPLVFSGAPPAWQGLQSHWASDTSSKRSGCSAGPRWAYGGAKVSGVRLVGILLESGWKTLTLTRLESTYKGFVS